MRQSEPGGSAAYAGLFAVATAALLIGDTAVAPGWIVNPVGFSSAKVTSRCRKPVRELETWFSE